MEKRKEKKKKKTKDNATGEGDEGGGDDDENGADNNNELGDDVDESNDDEPDPELSAEEQELLDLAGDIEEEELTTRYTNQVDDMDGWVDEVAEMTAEEQAALKESIRPVSRVLVKVRQQTYLEYILTASTASKGRVQNDQLHDHSATCVEGPA